MLQASATVKNKKELFHFDFDQLLKTIDDLILGIKNLEGEIQDYPVAKARALYAEFARNFFLATKGESAIRRSLFS